VIDSEMVSFLQKEIDKLGLSDKIRVGLVIEKEDGWHIKLLKVDSSYKHLSSFSADASKFSQQIDNILTENQANKKAWFKI